MVNYFFYLFLYLIMNNISQKLFGNQIFTNHSLINITYEKKLFNRSGCSILFTKY